MFCYKCGFPVDEKFNFCPHCAADLSIIKNQLASPDHSVPQKEDRTGKENSETAGSVSGSKKDSPDTSEKSTGSEASGSNTKTDRRAAELQSRTPSQRNTAVVPKIKTAARPKFYLTDPVTKVNCGSAEQESEPENKISDEKKPVAAVINSPDDLTPELFSLINTNRVESLTININGPFIDQKNCRSTVFSPSIKTIDFPVIVGEQVTDISGLFLGCIRLTKIRKRINVSGVMKADFLFFNCINLNEIPLSDFENIANIKQEISELYPKMSPDSMDVSTAKSLVNLEVLKVHQLRDNQEYQKYIREKELERYTIQNPVLNSFDDVSPELLESIANDELDSLTFNSDFFTVSDQNPFYLVKDRLASVSYPVKFGPSVATIKNLFSDCSMLRTVPQMDTSEIQDFSYAFSGCSELTSVPVLNTGKAVNMSGLFRNCTALTSVPKFNTSGVKRMDYMFQNCESILSIPNYETSNLKSAVDMLAGCKNLKSTDAYSVNYNSSRKGDGKTLSYLDMLLRGFKN